MTLPRSPRPRRKPRRRKPTRQEFYARVERQSARKQARDAAGWRAGVGLNVFWADCGKRCRRDHDCRAANPRACFEFHWGRLDKGDRVFRRDFMAAWNRLRDPDEAMVETIARALMRAGESGSAA